MPLFVTPTGVEIELSESAASRVGYKPKGDEQPKTARKPRQSREDQ